MAINSTYQAHDKCDCLINTKFCESEGLTVPFMKQKTIFLCSDCGYESAKWNGQCPACKNWNTMNEYTPPSASRTSSKAKGLNNNVNFSNVADRLSSVQIEDTQRFTTGETEFDRVLGGGIVKGSLVLIGGEPGIGKSTLLLQICEHLGKKRRVLYVSGEESKQQIKMRANRLGVTTDNMFVLAETNIDTITSNISKLDAQIVIIDSIQTMRSDAVNSNIGSVSQIRETTGILMNTAKELGVSIFIVGHITKEGAIAGPKVLEHMVDCVLYFEGESSINFRVLRSVKNRFGSTNEIGVFQMMTNGLEGVENPSAMLLDGRANASGSAVICSVEGSRGVLAELQALISPTGFSAPRRMSAGIDYNRMVLLIAVLEKRARLPLFNQDVYLNVAGGLKLNEPAIDLGICAAIASGLLDICLPSDIFFTGEVGLGGEVRAVSQLQKRLIEAKKLGFKSAIIPYSNLKDTSKDDDFVVYPIKNVGQMVAFIKKITS